MLEAVRAQCARINNARKSGVPQKLDAELAGLKKLLAPSNVWNSSKHTEDGKWLVAIAIQFLRAWPYSMCRKTAGIRR